MSAARERSVSHSFSCTALQWEQLRYLAERAGKPISRYIVDRVLRRNGSGAKEAVGGDALVLNTDEQRAMHDAAVRAEELISRLVEGPEPTPPDLGEAVRFLLRARLDEMARAGRHEAMRALLTSIVGEERAVRIVRLVLERNARGN